MMHDAEPGNAQRSIVVVHGRDFKPAAGALSDLSFGALRAGIERDFPDLLPAYDRVHRELPYYGDLSNAMLLDAGRYYDENLDIGDRRNALAALREIPVRKRFGIRQYDRLPGKTALREFVADLCMPVASRLGLTTTIVSAVSKDFAAYLRGSGDYAAQVRERVRTALVAALERKDRIMLITHGTGSAVAWDVLWELSHDDKHSQRVDEHKIEVWVTLGAPLGDSGIRKRLSGRGRRATERFPTNVISWNNVSAEDDYTCHDKTLADDFRRMMRDRVVSTVTDYKIYNHAVRYGRSNPHSSVGYFIHPRVAKIIADWLQAGERISEPVYTF